MTAPDDVKPSRTRRWIRRIVALILMLAAVGGGVAWWLHATGRPTGPVVVFEASAPGKGTVSYDGGLDANRRFDGHWEARFDARDAVKYASILVTPDGEDHKGRASCVIRVGKEIMAEDTADYEGGMALCVTPPLDRIMSVDDQSK